MDYGIMILGDQPKKGDLDAILKRGEEHLKEVKRKDLESSITVSKMLKYQSKPYETGCYWAPSNAGPSSGLMVSFSVYRWAEVLDLGQKDRYLVMLEEGFVDEQGHVRPYSSTQTDFPVGLTGPPTVPERRPQGSNPSVRPFALPPAGPSVPKPKQPFWGVWIEGIEKAMAAADAIAKQGSYEGFYEKEFDEDPSEPLNRLRKARKWLEEGK